MIPAELREKLLQRMVGKEGGFADPVFLFDIISCLLSYGPVEKWKEALSHLQAGTAVGFARGPRMQKHQARQLAIIIFAEQLSAIYEDTDAETARELLMELLSKGGGPPRA